MSKEELVRFTVELPEELAGRLDEFAVAQAAALSKITGIKEKVSRNMAIRSIELRQALPVPVDKLHPCIV